MKNAMKKLLSLMLVAVLLVSAVPFQASAAEGDGEAEVKEYVVPVNVMINREPVATYKEIRINAGETMTIDLAKAQELVKNWENREFIEWSNSLGTSFQSAELVADAITEGFELTIWLSETEEEEHTHSYTSVVTAPTCTADGYTTYTCSCGDSYTADVVATEGHSWGGWEVTTPATTTSEGVKTRTCGTCGETETDTIPMTEAAYVTFAYSANDEVKVEIKDGKVTTPSSKFVNGYSWNGWRKNGTGSLIDAGKTINAEDGDYYTASYTNTDPIEYYTLNVYARKYVDGVRKDTVLIHSNDNMRKGDSVLEYLDSVEGTLRNKVASNFPNCTWSGHYYNNYGDEVATDNVTTTNGAKNIYINVYSTNEADVLVYVYTDSTSSYDRLIEMNGFEKGEAITFAEVKDAVNDYYSGFSMIMYDAEGWADYKDGKSNTSTKSVEVNEGSSTTKIYVRLKNASSSSSSSKADSSNPKTGDNIFMTVSVMGLSAAALAAVYFFNKKRAVL